ncbi:MAG: radical SAM family heme chaperone HemW [Muricomes sp.]
MKKELELYVHIPFCVRKCAYCDFLSGVADEKEHQRYVAALIKEIHGYRKSYYENYEITTVFVGGGTPSILTGQQMSDIFEALRQSFQITKEAEITIEVNPGTAAKEKFHFWRQAEINRLSIGLQSVNDGELRMLGRIHTYQDFLDTYQMARECGFQNINIDLISAIPGQTVESWKKTISTISQLQPEHISAYSLIVEEGTPFYHWYGDSEDNQRGGMEKDRYLTLPDEDTERAIYELTEELLLQSGYKRYEISNYAKKGYACRHNLGYWERKEYLGIGLGASSLLNHTRYHNTSDYEKYIREVEGQTEIREDIEKLTLSDEIEEYMFLGLRKTNGISVKDFEIKFGWEITDVYGKELKKLEAKGLLIISGDRIYLTRHGINVSNAVFVEFMEPRLEDKVQP